MSRYVVLIQAVCPQEPNYNAYAITVSSNPAHGLNSLQSYCPIPCQLIHAIESSNRTEDLERTLHIRFATQRLRPRDFWFWLTAADVEFIKTITAENLTRVTGLIKRQLATDPQAFIATDKLPDFIAEQIEKCQNLLK